MSPAFIPSERYPQSFPARFIERLCKLIRDNDFKGLSNMLKKSFLPTDVINWGDSTGSSPLHIACGGRNAQIVELLLAHGANIELKRPNDGSNAFHIACDGASESVICLLFDEDNPIPHSARESDGSTHLHIACERKPEVEDLIELLLLAGHDPNIKRNDRSYPIHIAARQGDLNKVKLLLSYGASYKIEVWKSYVKLKESDGTGNIFADDTHTQGRSAALHIACEAGDPYLVQRMIDKGASVDQAREDGFYPLHIAAAEGHFLVAMILVQNNAAVNATSRLGYTPLLAAIDNGHFDIAYYLLQEGAHPNIYPKFEPPCYARVLYFPKHPQGVSLLGHILTIEANPAWRDEDGFTLLHLAAMYATVEHMKLIMLIKGMKKGAISRGGYTPLWSAARSGKLDAVKYLLGLGVDTTVEANDGAGTALDVAMRLGWDDIVQALVDHSVLMDTKDL